MPFLPASLGRGAAHVACAALLAIPFTAACADSGHDHGRADAVAQRADLRERAARPVHWHHPRPPHSGPDAPPVAVRILGFNDFHGQISTGRLVANRPVGGAAVFASYLKAASRGRERATIIANAGDNIGASPLSSALLRDEPTLEFFNQLANEECGFEDRREPYCNMIGTPGNHEFDKGKDELLRQLRGGNSAEGPFLLDPWPGLKFSLVSANIVRERSERPLLKPYEVKRVRYQDRRGRRKEVPIAFIGAQLKATPTIVTPSGVEGLAFIDEADAINRQVRELRRRGVKAIVVMIHQGGFQTNYQGDTDPARSPVDGEIVDIVNRLHPEVDVVISGHTHAFTNALLKAADGDSDILVTQAFSASTAYAEIDLSIDPDSGDVIDKSARIVTTFADEGPGLTPDPQAAALVKRAEETVAPIANRVITTYAGNITREATPAGESALGNLIADAQRAAMGTDFAFMNPGGIRADLQCATSTCNATYGALFTVQPFGNNLVRMTLTGDQVYRLLEQQFPPNQTDGRPRFLQISGLSYTWDNARVDATTGACNACIVDVRKDGASINRTGSYTVTVNSFLSTGGDRFAVLVEGTGVQGGPVDVDALIDYASAQPRPMVAPATGSRIVRLN